MADLHGVKVLVADDEPRLRAMVADCVRGLGAEVVEAADGAQAWQRYQRERPDLLVLDVMMPGMTGWELCKRVKAAGMRRRGGAPKVLMLTGIGARLNELTSPLFADDWIDKPFALAELADKVTRLAAGRSARRPRGAPLGSGPNLAKATPRLPAPSPGGAEDAQPKTKSVAGTAHAVAGDAGGSRQRRKRKKKQLKAARAAAAPARSRAAPKRRARPASQGTAKRAPKRAKPRPRAGGKKRR